MLSKSKLNLIKLLADYERRQLRNKLHRELLEYFKNHF